MMFSNSVRKAVLLALVIGVGSALAPAAHAQKYRTAAGLRFGKNNYGLTVQQKIF